MPRTAIADTALWNFRDFLDQIDAAVPKEREVRIVLDNYATHKTVLVRS